MISAGTFGNVIRLLVPLIATDEQIKEGLEVLHEVFTSFTRSGRTCHARQS